MIRLCSTEMDSRELTRKPGPALKSTLTPPRTHARARGRIARDAPSCTVIWWGLWFTGWCNERCGQRITKLIAGEIAARGDRVAAGRSARGRAFVVPARPGRPGWLAMIRGGVQATGCTARYYGALGRRPPPRSAACPSAVPWFPPKRREGSAARRAGSRGWSPGRTLW